ncbi:MAG: alpha-glucuronidase [Firmicutes bacterium]|nr:alpha-glucuronidase [Bacillota bacterium]
MTNAQKGRSYSCWLGYDPVEDAAARELGQVALRKICLQADGATGECIAAELKRAAQGLFDLEPEMVSRPSEASLVVGVGLAGDQELDEEGFLVQELTPSGSLQIAAKTDRGLLYGVFAFLRELRLGRFLLGKENPAVPLRMLNHWDNLDGSVERGYAGTSIFWDGGGLASDLSRVADYARLLASVGINGISVNNVNVHADETALIGPKLPLVARLADIFRPWGIRIFLSVSYASPVELGGLPTADPLDPQVQNWWAERARAIYSRIPDFGGFVVKADSEHRPGPFTYGRDHAQGANMLARALGPYGGIVVWRCFVYNCTQDWRDYKTDRAKAAYDTFMPLDGKFDSNVVLQIKNGPMDFQIREPVSPLFGGLSHTNQMLELQITQEYTGQQRDLCYLVPMWKEVLDFDTFARGQGSAVKDIVAGKVFSQTYSGIAGVANVGSDPNWTGHTLAQANLYGFARLCWDPNLSAAAIAEEWIQLTFGPNAKVREVILEMLLRSREIYENYTVPLGIGWMVNPGHHYGPNVDGYEYDRWGTYHRADCWAIGVDRTAKGGTGFAGQYHPPNAQMYESRETCPEELLLFFHRAGYKERLRSGKTLIQHIYDSHFAGVEQVEEMIDRWNSLAGLVDPEIFIHVAERLQDQLKNAIEWRDVVNSYFYRKSGIPDERGRTIY